MFNVVIVVIEPFNDTAETVELDIAPAKVTDAVPV